MTASVDHAARPESLFAELRAYIAQAQAQLAKRDAAALAAMNEAADALTTRLAALPTSATKDYATELQQLAADMHGVQTGMLALQREISTSIAALGHQKKASRAYNHTPTGMTEE